MPNRTLKSFHILMIAPQTVDIELRNFRESIIFAVMVVTRKCLPPGKLRLGSSTRTIQKREKPLERKHPLFLESCTDKINSF